MTLTLPTPTITTPFSPYADSRGRSRKITYTIREATEGQEGAAVQVTVSHDKDRKCYRVSIQPVTTEKTQYGTVTKFMAFSGVTVARIPTARFSKKDLEAHTAKTLENIPIIIAADPDIAAMFTDPAAASDRMFPR